MLGKDVGGSGGVDLEELNSVHFGTLSASKQGHFSSPQPGNGRGRERDGNPMREGCGKGAGIHLQFPHSRYSFFDRFQVRCMKATHLTKFCGKVFFSVDVY